MNDMSLKAKIRNIAREKQIPAQLVLQHYLNERFLIRLSMTRYREKFVVKGGTLITEEEESTFCVRGQVSGPV